MKARAAWRGMVLILSLAFCACRFLATWLAARVRNRAVTSKQRAEWMLLCGRVVLRAIGIRYRVEGAVPSGATLIAANHLSYLDIAIFSAAMPCAFVAKEEIARWPGFGALARLGGTIFLNRESRLSAWDAVETMGLRLADGVPVLFFPEGTSTDGRDVLRFHSTLFEAAVQSALPVVPAAVFYEPVGGGVAERDLCWFGEDLFVPHLKRVLGLADFRAVVRFGESEMCPDRRSAAWRSHEEVERMRSTYDIRVRRRNGGGYPRGGGVWSVPCVSGEEMVEGTAGGGGVVAAFSWEADCREEERGSAASAGSTHSRGAKHSVD